MANIPFLNNAYFAGKVGIGNASATKELEIGTNAAAETEFRMHSDVSGKYFNIQSAGNFTSVKTTGSQNFILDSSGTSGYLTFVTNASERMRINYNGRVGIGTTSPASKLHVAGSSNEQIKLVGSTGRVSINSASNSLEMYAWGNGVNIYSTQTDSVFFGRDAGVSNKFYYYDSSNVSTMLVNTATGRVGIGTTSPTGKLDVREANVTISTSNSMSDGVRGLKIAGSNAAIEFAGSGNDWWVSALGSGLSIYDTTANSYRFKIMNDGKVGIGTTSPSQKLHVDGNARVTGAYYDSGNTPGTANQLLASTATGTAWIDPSTIVAEAATLVVIACKNTTGATITKGTPVYQTGNVGATATIEIAPADALISANKLPAIGLLQTDLNNNGFGNVVITGELTNFTTDPIDGLTPTVGDKIFVKSGGGLTLTKPTGEGNGIQNMGLVGKVSSGNAGSITVSSIMRTNDVPNLPEGRIWVGDGNTIVSDTVYLDEPNERMGIGTTSPSAPLHVLDDSSANVLAKIRIQGDSTSGYGDIGMQSGYIRLFSNGSMCSAWTGGLQYNYINGSVATTLTSTGFGIGTTSPSQKLHVAGNMRLTGAFRDGVNSQGSANYVLTSTGSNSTRWVDASSVIGGPYLPLAGGTMTGNTNHSDNVKDRYGTGNDFQIWHDGSNTFLSNEGEGHLNIINTGDDRDIIFKTDDGSGATTSYMVIDGSAEQTRFYKDTRYTDGIKANFGDSNDLQIYHSGSHSYIKDTGTGSLYLQTNGSAIYLQDTDGNAMAQFTDGGGSFLFYNGNLKLSTTNTGVTVTGAVTATTFLGDLNGTINTATTAVTKANATNDTTVATTAFVQNLIGTIPAGLVFQGTWNAATNTPTLTSGSGTTGHFYIVSTDGSTNLDGITDWKVGDWAVFVEQGASDQWEKVDNSSVLDGSGTGGSVAGWAGSGTSNTLTNAPITFSGNNTTFAGNITTNTGLLDLNIGTTNIGIEVKSTDAGSYIRFDDGDNADRWYLGVQSGDFGIYNNANEKPFQIDSSKNATFTGALTSGTHTINSGNDAILTLNQTGTDTGWSYINFNTSGTRNYYVGQDSQKNWEVYNDNLNVVAISVKYATNFVNIGGDLTVEGGDITLSGTGRIQGIDTVSASTDAANKAYVDAHGGGLGPFLPLAGGTMTGDTKRGDNIYSYWGNSDDLAIYHLNGASSIYDRGAGNLNIFTNGGSIGLRKDSGENMLIANIDGSVDLYYDNSKKFETSNTGISVTGNGIFTGNVGIGTTSPSAKLNVTNGNILVDGSGIRQISLESSNDEVRFGLKGNNGNQFRIISDGTHFKLNDATKERIKITNAGDITFSGRDASNNQATYVTIKDQTGNVGIGTTSPGAKLQVDGSVKVGSGAVTDNNSLTVYGNNGTASKYIKLTHHNASSSSIQTDNTYLSISASNYIVLGSNALIYQGVKFTNNKQLEYQESDNSYFTVLNVNSSNLVQLGSVTGVSSGGDTALYHNGAEKVRITSVGVGIGTTSPVYKLDVNGGARAGGVVTYSKYAGSLTTTGYAVAGLTSSSNGNSTGFTFTCFGHTGGYQKIVYSCRNETGTWKTSKVINEGTNDFDVEASADGTTITFTFKSTSGTKFYSPRVTIEATGHSINSTYA